MEFSRQIGVDMTTMRNIETGRSNPGIELAFRIFHSLHISLDYVVAGRLVGMPADLTEGLLMAHPELAPPGSSAYRTPISDTLHIDLHTNICGSSTVIGAS
jgi:DNA-binding XRE family transcriptional regulator